MDGANERRGSRRGVIDFGMHVFDVHDQFLGVVVLVCKDRFVMRQEVGMNQLVEIPTVAVSGVVAGMVFLSLTPGELEIFGRTLERREFGSRDCTLRSRTVQPRLAQDTV